MDKIERIKEFVKEKLKGEATGHDYWHALRVWKNTKQIGEGMDVDKEVVEISALVHDLIDEKVEQRMGKNELEKKLEEFGVDKEKIEKIIFVIDNISFSKNVPKEKLSLEAKIVQDADKLDALGAIGIARVFAYSGKAGRPIYDPEIKVEFNKERRIRSKTAINHFYEKLFLLKEEMNTEKAKEIAEKREQFMVEFLRRFFEEWEGRN